MASKERPVKGRLYHSVTFTGTFIRFLVVIITIWIKQKSKGLLGGKIDPSLEPRFQISRCVGYNHVFNVSLQLALMISMVQVHTMFTEWMGKEFHRSWIFSPLLIINILVGFIVTETKVFLKFWPFFTEYVCQTWRWQPGNGLNEEGDGNWWLVLFSSDNALGC